ncbi:MAG: twin-arginine translocase subunit TatC [Magnetococcales bacterium]|nr:twin-arginine translocase subunit TatC [Magnetococcales bacterium]
MTQELDDKAPLLDHLIELRRRLTYSVVAVMVGFFGCYAFAEEVFGFLVAPLRQITGSNSKMIFTGLHEAFFTYMKVSFYAGLFLAVPVILWQLWIFVAPGLYRNEKRVFLPFLVMTPVLFFFGATLAYVFIFPLIFKYFLSFSTTSIESLPSVREYLDLVLSLLFAFGIVFEMPVGLLLLVRVGFLSTASLVAKRKYFIVLAFIIAGLLVPPDPFSQVMAAIPLIILYEISIVIGRFLEKDRIAAQAKGDL